MLDFALDFLVDNLMAVKRGVTFIILVLVIVGLILFVQVMHNRDQEDCRAKGGNPVTVNSHVVCVDGRVIK